MTRLTLLATIAALLLNVLGGNVIAADPPEPGQFVTVGNPITSGVVGQIREAISRAQKNHPLRKVVFDFNPDGKEAATDDIGPSLSLALYIQEQRKAGLFTVAFVRNKTTRHTVLPVLACDQLVMAPNAQLGAVSENAQTAPNRAVISNYLEFARPDQAALVLKMLDARAEILEGQKNRAVYYVDARQEAEAVQNGVTIANRNPILRAGTLGLFSAADALKFQLAWAVRATRQQVEELYNLPLGSFREDLLGDRKRQPWRIVVRGEVNGGMADSFKRQLERAAKNGGNLLFLQIECSGGSPEIAREIAETIRTLKNPDGGQVMSVAFVPQAAPDTATFIAMGCHEIVMAKAARLGDFDGWRHQQQAKGKDNVEPKHDLNGVRDSLMALAQEQGYSPTLIRGLFDDQMEIIRGKRIKGAIQDHRFMTPEELDEKDENGQKVWNAVDTVKHAGKPLVINGENAANLGFARKIVGGADDLNEVYRFYQVEPGQIREGVSDWLDKIATFLAEPYMAVFLVLIGISCLIIELKMPGASLPGIIAAVCFVLFFWSQSQLNGQITMLAVLLFMLGIVLLGLEIFVIPGFGIIGISGIGLILFGLALATVERMPQTPTEWSLLGRAVLRFGLSLSGAVVLAFFAGRFLPYIPIANRLMLPPPDEQESDDPLRAAQLAENLQLLGAIGTAATMLRPSGMAQFGDRFVDVVTEGAFIPAGARVRVIEIEGYRVVVKEVSA